MYLFWLQVDGCNGCKLSKYWCIIKETPPFLFYILPGPDATPDFKVYVNFSSALKFLGICQSLLSCIITICHRLGTKSSCNILYMFTAKFCFQHIYFTIHCDISKRIQINQSNHINHYLASESGNRLPYANFDPMYDPFLKLEKFYRKR